jgi:hypothetical protein
MDDKMEKIGSQVIFFEEIWIFISSNSLKKWTE